MNSFRECAIYMNMTTAHVIKILVKQLWIVTVYSRGKKEGQRVCISARTIRLYKHIKPIIVD